MYIVNIPPSRVVTFPKEFKDFIKKGDRFSVDMQGETIFLKKIPSPGRVRVKTGPGTRATMRSALRVRA